MIYCFSGKKNIFDRFQIILFILPLLVSCASKKNEVVEIIYPPKFPTEFSSIPEKTNNPQLLKLLPLDQKMQDIDVGRNDPFLPPQQDSNQISIPNSFKYHGQISSKGIVNAFVSYNNYTGTIKKGDIGGDTTNLLPSGWFVESLDLKTQALTLNFDKKSIKIDLFPEVNGMQIVLP